MKIDYLKNHLYFVDEISKLFYEEWSYLVPDRSLEDFKKSIVERANLNILPIAIVVFDNNSFIGTACIKIHDMETKKELTPWLAGVYIKKEYRKQGIAKKLIFEIYKIAKELKLSRLYLYTPSTEEFYKTLGWNTIEKTTYNGTEVSIMKTEL